MSVDETPLPSLPCPRCGKFSRLQTWVAVNLPLYQRDELTAAYRCDGGHEIRVTVAQPPSFGGTAA